MFLRILFFSVLLILSCCGRIPADPEKSFGKVKESSLPVGCCNNPSCVMDGDNTPGGIEADPVMKYASSKG